MLNTGKEERKKLTIHISLNKLKKKKKKIEVDDD